MVDGVPMSGLLAEATHPRAVVVALHGGATTSVYFDCPGHPRLSLVRLAPMLGYSVLALDRPGFGASALYPEEFDDTSRRIEMTYRAIDAILAERDRGAGIFLLAHSNGSELALRMAVHSRRTELIGLEFSGTGRVHQQAAAAVLAGASRENMPTGVRELLWEPVSMYPPGIPGSVRIKSGPVSPGYEATVVADWCRDLPELAAAVRIPLRYTLAEFERVWAADAEAVADIAALFTAAPRVVTHRQTAAGHNLSLGYTAAAYHMNTLAFAEECVVAAAAAGITMEVG